MSNHSIPSNFKGLSLAIAQVVAVSAIANSVSAAPSCDLVVSNASPSLVLNADTTGNVCSETNASTTVTLSSGVTLTASDYREEAISVRRGTVTLESGASIESNQDSRAATGVSLNSNGYSNTASTITLGENSTINIASDSSQAKGGGVKTRAIDVYAEGAVTINLNAGSSVASSASSPNSYAEAAAISVESNFSHTTDNVDINAQDATITASASGVAEVSQSYAFDLQSSAVSVEDVTNATVDLSDSTVTSTATADLQGNTSTVRIESLGILADATTHDPFEASLTQVLLDNTSIDVDTTVEGDGYGSAVSVGVVSAAYSYYEGASAVVDINGGSVDVSSISSSELSNEGGPNLTVSIGALAQASSDKYGESTSITLNGGAELNSHADGQFAVAMGVSTKYGSDTSSVILSGASLEVSAEGYGAAMAMGIASSARDLDIELQDAEIRVSATNTGYVKGGMASATGISASGDDVSIDLTDSSVTVAVSAQEASGGPGKYGSSAIRVDGRAAAVTLNGSSLVVQTSESTYGFGIYDESDYGAVITLDSGSRIEADVAVYSEGDDAQLINFGNVTGNVEMFRGLVDNSGTTIGRIVAETLNVRETGVVVGTADVVNLHVEEGGELEVVLTDEVDPETAHFTAVDATFEDGSKIHLNATSELYNPDIDGIDYLVVEADNSLIADTDEMILKTSGLIGADWVECGPLSLCVSVRALELEEIAIGDGSSSNGVDAAGAAQSVLEELSGSETADTFLELIERVVDDEAWEELDGSGQGENLLASRDAERVVSRYVQRLMQQGRSSGEEFSAAQGLWMQALQTDGDGDSDNGVAGFEVDTTGFAIGYDRELRPGLVIGGVVSSADTEVESDDNMNRVDTDTLMASIYGQWTQGPLFANAVMTYGRGDNDSRREVVGDIASADYDSDFLSMRIQGGKEFGFESGWKLSPRVEVAYNHVNIDSYDESGSVAALSVASQSYETLELGLGLEIAKPIIVEKAVWTPYFDLAVYHDFADDQVQSNSRFVIGGNSFVTTGSDVEQTNISATLGLSYAVGANHSLKAAYEYFGNSSYDSASWMLRYSYGF